MNLSRLKAKKEKEKKEKENISEEIKMAATEGIYSGKPNETRRK